MHRNVSMKARLLRAGLAACWLAASPAAIAAPRAETPSKPAADAAQDQMMAEMTRLASPGPNHESLKALAGSWKTLTKAWMGPGDPQTSEGTSELSLILGGRFLREDFNSSFMGQPFQGFGLTGYDNIKGQYIGAWVDTMGTSIMRVTGRYDASGRQFSMMGSYPDPSTKKDVNLRMVTKIVDDNKHVASFYENRDGKEVMTMEITYTRK